MLLAIVRTAILLLVSASAVVAQTSAFKYQGSLTDGGNPANGNFQMQFKLFNAASGGTQIGSTLNDLPVTAGNGVFSVALDFGASAFNGANRWIEIAVRRNSSESYVTLSPREQIASAPYAVKSISAETAATATNATNAANSAQLGGLPPSRYVQTDTSGNVGIGASPATGSRLTVGGQLEITSGGIKFPNATTQTTAGLASVTTTGPFTGNGTPGSPLGIVSPLSTRETNPASRQPHHSTHFQAIVPVGKLLVIEYVSATLTQSATLPLPLLSILIDGSTRAHVPPDTWQEIGGTRTWIVSKQVRIYATAGQGVNVAYSANATPDIHVWGYYIDIP